MSTSVNKALREARRHASRGEIDLATREYESILAEHPQNERAILGLKSLREAKQPSAAHPDPAPEAQINEVIALGRQGRFQEALRAGELLAQRFPEIATVPYLLGTINSALGRSAQAIACYEHALRLKPDMAEAHYNLGIALEGEGDKEAAAQHYAEASRIQPNLGEAHNNLGALLEDLGRREEAVRYFRDAIRAKPRLAIAHNNLGHALDRLRQSHEAVASCEEALRIDPEYAEAMNNLGNALQHLGRANEAAETYQRALKIRPDYAEAHQNLSTLKTFLPADSQIEQMLHLLKRDNLPPHDRMLVNFALGKAFGDTGDYDEASACFLEANRLRAQELDYEPGSTRARLKKLIDSFSRDFPKLEEDADAAGGSMPKPIFVLGMPRSGTTLVEQILASHSQVYGAGELEALEQAVSAIGSESPELSRDQLSSLRDSYFSAIGAIGASEPLITDKMPFNFWWIGFILAAIPESKIVHVKRDARATCWSCFRHYFPNRGIGFTNDFEDLATYYRHYAELMAFWRQKFPARIHDLSYEELTENQESETRNLLAYVGLDWEDQCLEFHKTSRAVHTASAAQVRQEMYRGSSEEWRKYARHLKPMIELLGDL